ncbi:MAG: PAS domain-containing protein [Acidobacteriota bacterium]
MPGMIADVERLQEVLDGATLGVWEVDLASLGLVCSAQCKANFGRPADEPFTYAELFAAIHADDRQRVADAINLACTVTGIYQAEYRVRWPDATTHWISARGTLERVDGRNVRLVGVTMDVTAHKAASEAERAARELSDRLIESSADCIKVLDLSGRVLWVSPAGLRLLEASSSDLVGRLWTAFWTGDARVRVRRAIAAAVRGETGQFEARSRTPGGTDKWWDVRVTPVRGPDGAPERLLAVSRDITERKALEAALLGACEGLEERVSQRTAELQALGERLETVREEERMRLARELHDELGQTLTALKLDVRVVRRAVDGRRGLPGTVASSLRDMESLLDDTLVAIERIVTELRPAVLDELGFCAAAEWHVQQFAARSGIAASFDCPEDLELGDPAATALFRVLQEALTNVARHAGANRVHVSVVRSAAGFELEITDNGCGLPAERRSAVSYGLRGMEERVRAIGGQLILAASGGQGTRVLAQIPQQAAS